MVLHDTRRSAARLVGEAARVAAAEMILTDFEVRLMAENARMALEIARLERYVAELREGLDALLQPASSELLPKNSAHPSRRQ